MTTPTDYEEQERLNDTNPAYPSRVIRYNHNISMTEENDALWRKYMRCHYPGGTIRPELESMAAHYLKLMDETKYPKAVYAG